MDTAEEDPIPTLPPEEYETPAHMLPMGDMSILGIWGGF